MLEAAVTWLTEVVFRLGYVGIALLMALESSLVPFPSEVVLPPAGFLAAQGRMSAPLAFGAGLLGSLVGALFNYFLAAKLGRPVLHRYGKYMLIKEASLVRSEEFFRRHGEISTFVGRLIPVIRQLISLPAGMARMRLDRFLFYTTLGAGIWCAVLTWIGWFLGKHSNAIAGFDRLAGHEYVARATLVLMPILALIVGIYVYRQRRNQRSSSASGSADAEDQRDSAPLGGRDGEGE